MEGYQFMKKVDDTSTALDDLRKDVKDCQNQSKYGVWALMTLLLAKGDIITDALSK
jgi:hypothetical protein